MICVPFRQAFFCVCALAAANSFLWAVPPESVIRETQAGRAAREAASEPMANTASSPPPVSSNVQFLSQVTPQQFATNAACTFTTTDVCANDCWGYVSPSGREYAIIGLYRGTGFVDITDPLNPEIVTSIDDAPSVWSDVTVYGDFAFNANENSGGLQIFDLRNIDPPTRQVTMTTFTGSGLQTVHTMTVNPASQTLYLSGSNLSGGRLIAVNISNPLAPTLAGASLDAVYVHQAEVITYTEGPYAGREIAFCYAGGNGLRVLDVTNKSNMFRISTFTYPNLAYCHQGSITPDRQYVLLNDELDNLPLTRIVNVSNLSALTLAGTFQSSTTIDHDLFIVGEYVFEANYTSGLHIFRFGGPGDVIRTGYYDTYHYNDAQTFDGAWANYPFFPSGNVIVSDMQGGLFVLDPSEALGGSCEAAAAPLVGEFTDPRQRYLSVSPGNAGISTGLRVRLASLPPAFASHVGEYLWVDTPVELPDPKGSGETYFRARLRCTPRYLDWGTYPSIEIADDAVVPGAIYEVQAVGANCNTEIESNYSGVLMLATSDRWGDVAGNGGNAPSDGIINAIDIAAVVDAVKAISGSLDVTEADINPSEPDFLLNAVDIARAVDAVKGSAFPFPGPATCP